MGSFPEHTRASYSAAYFENVDFIELDLQLTKDGHLVTSHDPTLKEITDIEDHHEFADRKGTFHFGFPFKVVHQDDWLIHDFTLEEIKKLKRKQRFDFRNSELDGLFPMMTLDEIIEMMLSLHKNHKVAGRTNPIGLYIEPKMYDFYLKHHHMDIVQMTYDCLDHYHLENIKKSSTKVPIIIESFEP